MGTFPQLRQLHSGQQLFKFYSNTKIFVLCPAQGVSGGPEALHQLVDKLRKFGHEAYIIYLPSMANPSPQEYQIYNIKYAAAEAIIDSPEDILIVPEVWPHLLKLCPHIQKGIWWLSAHNSPNKSVKQFRFNLPENREVVHMAQSRYAEHFLFSQGARYIHPLTDYLNRLHFSDPNISQRKNQILFSTKGRGMVEKLKLVEPGIKWVALENMSSADVRALMASSKVYADFGYHPGKDRMPREAAANGCCVVVGMRGAAAFHQDVSIPNAYRFDTDQFDMVRVILTVEDCMLNYEERIKDFDNYIRIIEMNEEQFEVEVKQVFGVRGPQ